MRWSSYALLPANDTSETLLDAVTVVAKRNATSGGSFPGKYILQQCCCCGILSVKNGFSGNRTIGDRRISRVGAGTEVHIFNTILTSTVNVVYVFTELALVVPQRGLCVCACVCACGLHQPFGLELLVSRGKCSFFPRLSTRTTVVSRA